MCAGRSLCRLHYADSSDWFFWTLRTVLYLGQPHQATARDDRSQAAADSSKSRVNQQVCYSTWWFNINSF
jgi:hypothetical protein